MLILINFSFISCFTYKCQTHGFWTHWRPASCLYRHQATVHSPCKVILSCRSRSVQPLQGRDAVNRCWQSMWNLQQWNKAMLKRFQAQWQDDNCHKKHMLIIRYCTKLVRLHCTESRLAVSGITCLTVIWQVMSIYSWTDTHTQTRKLLTL